MNKRDTTYFINGSFVKKENAFIHVNDIGLLRGYAVFDYFKTYLDKTFYFYNKTLNSLISVHEEEFIQSNHLPNIFQQDGTELLK